MLLGVCFKANPTTYQKLILSQWMGCARFIWNGKCEEERYYSTFARKYYPTGTYAPVDQTTAQFKHKELSPWLYDCPSQIIRNSAANWYQTFRRFMKGLCGKPKRKPKTDKGSIHLTRELFRFEQDEYGMTRLFIGTKTNNMGYLSFKAHRLYQIPNSIYLKKSRGRYTVSFCYEKAVGNDEFSTDQAHLDYLKNFSNDYLNKHVIGIDRGVIVPVQVGDQSFKITPAQAKKKAKAEKYIKSLQRKLARQVHKSSHRRNKTKHRIAKHYAKCANIRKDFCHKTSHALVNSEAKVFILEDLKTINMTKAPNPKQDAHGRFISNKAKQKAGLNKAILDIGWHLVELFIKYKAIKAGKVVFKISAAYTSQECVNCDHIHPDNRRSQEIFHCVYCDHIDHADRNASLVIKKRAINLILHTGTVLSEKGVLTSSDIGRGAKSQSSKDTSLLASGCDTSKKKMLKSTKVAA